MIEHKAILLVPFFSCTSIFLLGIIFIIKIFCIFVANKLNL